MANGRIAKELGLIAMILKLPTINFMRGQAKGLKKLYGLDHFGALNVVARSYGYDNWNHFLKIRQALDNQLKARKLNRFT